MLESEKPLFSATMRQSTSKITMLCVVKMPPRLSSFFLASHICWFMHISKQFSAYAIYVDLLMTTVWNWLFIAKFLTCQHVQFASNGVELIIRTWSALFDVIINFASHVPACCNQSHENFYQNFAMHGHLMM